MSRKVQLYATRDDLLALCEAVESERPLAYAQTGDCTGPTPAVFQRAKDIPEFGFAAHGETLREASFFVTDQATPIVVDPIPQPSGRIRHYLSARMNPDAINLQPCGSYQREAVIEGVLTCFSDSKSARELYRLFQRAVRRLFLKVKDVYVGPMALEAYKQGMRLTQSVKSPSDWDIAIEDKKRGRDSNKKV